MPKKYSTFCLTIYLLIILVFDSSRTTLDFDRSISLLGHNSTVLFLRFFSFFVASQYPHYTRVLPSIRRKDRRDIDGSLGLSTFTLRRSLFMFYRSLENSLSTMVYFIPIKPLESFLLLSVATVGVAMNIVKVTLYLFIWACN